MKTFVLLFLTICGTAVAQITDVSSQNELYAFMQKAESVTLYSIDPNPPGPAAKDAAAKPDAEKFEGYVVLGKIVGDRKELAERIRTVLISAVISPAETYECFEPRIGVSLATKDKRLNILLCYQCHQSRFYIDGEWEEGPLGTSGEKEFNDMFDARGIKRNIPKPHPAPAPQN
jgi:hypothetical protein